MGDDCLDNSRDYVFNADSQIDDIMPVIKENHFLASISGNNVVWVLINSKGEEILSYYTLKDTVIKCTSKSDLKDICAGKYELHFRYYTSLKKRREYISSLNQGSQYLMYRNGWFEEYKMCMGD